MANGVTDRGMDRWPSALLYRFYSRLLCLKYNNILLQEPTGFGAIYKSRSQFGYKAYNGISRIS